MEQEAWTSLWGNQAEMLGITFLGKMEPLRVFEQRRLILAELEDTESGSRG